MDKKNKYQQPNLKAAATDAKKSQGKEGSLNFIFVSALAISYNVTARPKIYFFFSTSEWHHLYLSLFKSSLLSVAYCAPYQPRGIFIGCNDDG